MLPLAAGLNHFPSRAEAQDGAPELPPHVQHPGTCGFTLLEGSSTGRTRVMLKSSNTLLFQPWPALTGFGPQHLLRSSQCPRVILVTTRLGKRQLKAHWLQVKLRPRVFAVFTSPCRQDFKPQLSTARKRKNKSWKIKVPRQVT